MSARAIHGPRAAGWTVETPEPRYACGWRPLVSTDCHGAHRDAAYYRSECGYTVRIVRTEFCTVPGCDGHGTVKVRGRGGMYRDTACKAHVAPIVTIEEA